MVPYKGLYSIHHYVKSKPFGHLFWTIKFGYKLSSLCSNDGYRYHLDIYCRKSGEPINKFGLDGKVVLEMVNVLKDMNDDITKCELFFDNYFTSFKLMKKISDNRILVAGTVKKNKQVSDYRMSDYRMLATGNVKEKTISVGR